MDLQKLINSKESRIIELKTWLDKTEYQRAKVVQKIVIKHQVMSEDDNCIMRQTDAARAEINNLELEIIELQAEDLKEKAEMELTDEFGT